MRLWDVIRRLYARARLLWRWLPRLRWQMFEYRRDEDLHGYRTPIQVCPRGCEYHELARREVVARTRITGRAATHVAFRFEITNCPKCGAQLARACPRCERDIVAPLAALCHFCGLPQPWASERRAGIERASLLRWSKDDDRANAPADPLYTTDGEHGGVWVIEGDVVQLNVDTVISDNDVDGQMWAQVARAIKIAAGEGVERLAQEGKPFKLGDAWWTSAGNLRQMRGIIHVASMDRNGGSKLEIVRDCLAAAFIRAGEHQCESIGVAAIGSGPASISLSKWSRTFAGVAVKHLEEMAQKRNAKEAEAKAVDLPPLSIVLVLFEPADFAADRALLERSIWYAWVKAGRPPGGEPKTRLTQWRRLRLTVSAEVARRANLILDWSRSWPGYVALHDEEPSIATDASASESVLPAHENDVFTDRVTAPLS
jgi:O-acetyl-ADP-ribose deacetylase (regulator of RNase III)